MFIKIILFFSILFLIGCGGTSQEPESNLNGTSATSTNTPTMQNLSISLDEDTNTTLTKQLFLTAYTFSTAIDSVKVISLPTNGVIKLYDLNITTNQIIDEQNLSAISYTPNPNFNQHDSFKVQAISGVKLSNISDVNITVNNINDTPTLDISSFEKSFEKKIILSDIDSTSSIFAIDLNKDNKLDILTTSEDKKRVIWLENIDNINFTEHNISTSLDGARSVMGVDLDRDGDIDILATARMDNTVIWFENNGSEHFTSHMIDNLSDGASDLKVADIDNDNDLDIAVVSYNDNKLSWYKNNNLTFTKIEIDTNLSSASSVAIYDMDNDGYQDIVASSFDTGTLRWYKQNQDGTFTQNDIYDNGNGTNSIFINEGVIYSTNYNSQNLIQSTISGVNFTNITITSLFQTNSLVVKDMDGDGDDDLVVSSFGVSSVTWYEKTPNGYITHKIEGYDKVSDVTAVDIDGDGDEDIIASGFESDKVMLYNSKDSIFTYENNKSVTQIISHDIDGDTLIFSIEGEDKNQFDINSSGYLSFKTIPDFEAPTDSDTNNMYNITIQIADNNTTIEKDIRVVVQNLTRFEQTTIKDNLDVINDIAVHQGNIAVVSNQAPELYILKQDGTQTNITHSLNNPSAVEFFNNNIIVSFSSGDGVVLYKENNFTEQIIDNHCDFASDVISSDINSDGRVDIASTCIDDREVRWYLQQADGNFTTHSFILDNTDLPLALTAFGANHKDIIVASHDNHSIYKLTNDGNENFTKTTLDNNAQNVSEVSSSGDNIFSVSTNDDILALYKNGNKTTLNTSKTFSALNSLDVGDIDGDGDDDIVVTSRDDGKVTWFENLGNDSYKQTHIAEVKEPVKVVISDLDNDGVKDIIIATKTAVLFFKNTTIESLF